MYIHIFWLFLFLIMLEETIQYRETYKVKNPHRIRPRYRQKPKSYYRPKRYHPGPPKQRYKSPPGPNYYQSHEAHYPRHPHFADNDYFEDQSHLQPYVIEIELPKKFGKYNNGYHDRHYDRNTFHDNDYLDDDDDYQTRWVRSGNKRFKVKMSKEMNPKLRIKISREDNEDGINNIDTPEMIHSLLSFNEEVVNSKLQESPEYNWFPVNSPQIYSQFIPTT